MAKTDGTSKKALIDKANSTMVISVAVAGFVIVFSLIATRALWSQRSYQARVISRKEKAVKQLNDNIKAVDQLAVSYKAFVDTPDNVLGGNPKGTGDKDGDNAKITLDALPSKYDFPAFITSVEKLLNIKGYTLKSISGKDDEESQSVSTKTTKTNSSSSKSTSNSNGSSDKPVEIPFQFSTELPGYPSVKDLLLATELSIRPISVKKLSITGSEKGGSITVDVDAVSFFQAAKGVKIEKKVVK